jgi:hypothetical protein
VYLLRALWRWQQAGHTELCESLRSLDCAWDAHTTAAAARYGHTDTLRFLHEAGCPWDVKALIYAYDEPFACADPLPVLQYWAYEGALSDPHLLLTLLNWAGSSNKLSIALWLRQQGAEWPSELQCSDGDTPWPAEMVAWARAEGCTAPTTAAPDEVITQYAQSIYILCTLRSIGPHLELARLRNRGSSCVQSVLLFRAVAVHTLNRSSEDTLHAVEATVVYYGHTGSCCWTERCCNIAILLVDVVAVLKLCLMHRENTSQPQQGMNVCISVCSDNNLLSMIHLVYSTTVTLTCVCYADVVAARCVMGCCCPPSTCTMR